MNLSSEETRELNCEEILIIANRGESDNFGGIVKLLTPSLEKPIILDSHEPIGIGQYSQVFSAICSKGNDIALKVGKHPEWLPSYNDLKVREKILKEEIKIHKEIDKHHLNKAEGVVVGFVDSGILEDSCSVYISEEGHKIRDVHYIATELMDGTMDYILDLRKSLDFYSKFNFSFKVADKVNLFHKMGYAHGDLKPGNILMNKKDYEVKLGDLGNAIKLGENDLKVNILRVTTEYTSPERWKGYLPSVGSDIFAMGVMMYELFEGRHPFAGNSRDFNYIKKSICEGELIESRDPKFIKSGLSEIVANSLEYDQDDRYPTMDDMMYDLAECTIPR